MARGLHYVLYPTYIKLKMLFNLDGMINSVLIGNYKYLDAN